MTIPLDILGAAWDVLGQMSPYLLLGFLVAGALSAFVSPQWVERHLGGRGLGPVVKTAMLGVPLPLCSCGVLPVAASLRAHGASRGAAVSFLIATPQTGVDSILATYALLGPVYAIFRPVAALISGIVGGAVMNLYDAWQGERTDERHPQKHEHATGCCDACDTVEAQGGRIRGALYYGMVTLPRDIAKALLAGVLLAGALTVLVPQGALTPYLGGGLIAMLAMIAVGIPMYVCATASIPIAVAFMHLGASPGAALAFLIAGPATNAAALAVVWRILGRGAALIYLGTIALGAFVSGLLLDAIFDAMGSASPHLAEHMHEHEAGGGAMQSIWAALLLAILAISFILPKLRKKSAPVPADSNADTLTLTVAGMTCSHCVDTVTRTLREVPGVTRAEVTLDTGQAVVAGKGLTRKLLADALARMGFTVRES